MFSQAASAETLPIRSSTHVLDRGFIVTPGRLGYAIELYGPDTGWSAVRASVWQGLLQTFMPGG